MRDRHGIRASMSRKGNCWDNAVTETFFGSLKVERLHGERFETIRQAKDVVLAWLLSIRFALPFMTEHPTMLWICVVGTIGFAVYRSDPQR